MENSLKELLDVLPDLKDTEKAKWCRRFSLYYENREYSDFEVSEFILRDTGGEEYYYKILSQLEEIYNECLLEEETQSILQSILFRLINFMKVELLRKNYLATVNAKNNRPSAKVCGYFL